MSAQSTITVFSADSAGNLTPIDGQSLVVQFPDGRSMEITWDRHPDDPRPMAIAVWGGLSPKEEWSGATIEENTASLMVMPSAANVVLISPMTTRRDGSR